jgi:hypothetical protein
MSKAAEFGEGFVATLTKGKNIIAFGEDAANLVGGLRFKNIALFGIKEVGLISKPGSTLAS